MTDRLKAVALVVLATLALLWPMVLNHSTILYPDSAAYFFDANQLAKAVSGAGVDRNSPPLSGRSLFYGVIAWAAAIAGGTSAVSLLQAVWVAIVLAVLLPRVGFVRRRAQLAVVVALSLFSSLAFFADTMLPDVFAGIGAVALAMLLGFGRDLGRGERAFWLSNLAVAGLVHVAVLLMLVAVFCLFALLARRSTIGDRGLAAAGLALALAATLLVPPASGRLTASKAPATPFLLARMIGDGPAARLLIEDCPTHPYASCRYVRHFPMTEEAFLWSPFAGDMAQRPPGPAPYKSWNELPDAERAAISAEATQIVVATLKRYPVEQLAASVGNSLHQLVEQDLRKFGRERIVSLVHDMLRFSRLKADAARYRQSAIGTGDFPLGGLSQLWLGVYLAAALAIPLALGIAHRRRQSVDPRLLVFVAVLMLAVVINAAIGGAISIVVGRYQSRVAWLVLLSAIILVRQLQTGLTPSQRAPAATPI